VSILGIKKLWQELFKGKPRLAGDIRWQRRALAVTLYMVILTIVFLTVAPARVDLEPGRPSPRDITADRDTIDIYSTNQLREEAARNVPESYDYDPTVITRVTERVDLFFVVVRQFREDTEPDGEEKATALSAALAAEAGVELSESLAAVLLAMRSGDLNEMQLGLHEVLGTILQQGVRPGGLETARRQIVQEINFLLLPQDQKRIMDKLAQGIIEPNMIYNPTATALAREAARLAVEPVRIVKDTVLIRRGELVTNRHIRQLEALGLVRGQADYTMFFGLALLLMVVFGVVGIYLFLFQPDIYRDITRLLLLGLIVLITLVLVLAATYFSGYMVPVAMAAMLIAILLNPRLAILMTIILSVLVALLTGNDFRFLLVAMFGGLIAVYSISNFNRRSDLTRAGLYVALVNVVTIVGLFLLAGTLRLEYVFLREFSISILAGITNGFFSAVLTIGLLPYLESGFRLTTSVTLLELANPNHPLLKRLLMEAPGTYHHSLVVANLAEAAAESIGADPLLARVGAFYHDIGKLKRPYFFIENQMGDNPHEKISPNLSTLIITSHLKDGCELGKKEKLPKVIRDIICQHHGNSLVSYFYHQAAEKDREGTSEDNFRYGAPLPQSKEAAIILLADSVEAAARAMPKPISGRIEAVVRKIVREKLADGQFDQCDLTLKELDIIAGTFVRILSGIYHNRIEYPEKDLKEEMERGRKSGGESKQPPGQNKNDR
jgi:putative nucleotidyltransferase with HDIG domain